MGKIIFTDDRPTGRLHVGHYVGSPRHRVEFQNSGGSDETHIMIADAQALIDNANSPEGVRQNTMEVALGYLVCGPDPSKSVLFIQSQIPGLCKVIFYYMDPVTVSRLQRNPAVKSEIQMCNFETSTPVGFFTYSINQAADITAFKATTVPMGEGQAPVTKQTRETVHKFNIVYGDSLVEPDILFPDNKAYLRLSGTDGRAKIGGSLGNRIHLANSEVGVKKKIISAFTNPNHLRAEGPGQMEGNPVFVYLDAFCRDEYFTEYPPDYENLGELKAYYMGGGLGNVKVKKFLDNALQDELRPIRERRKEFAKDILAVYRILEEGDRKARTKAIRAPAEMKRAMKINYFEDKDLITEQALRSQSEEQV